MTNDTSTAAVVKIAQTMKETMNGKQKLLFGVGAIALLAVAAPVITMAFNAVENLVELILFLVGTGVFVISLPMLKRKWKNKVLNMMLTEAQRNPILVLRNQSLDKHEALEKAKKVTSSMIGKLNGIADSLQAFRDKYSRESDARKIYDRMKPIVERVQASIKASEKALDEFDAKIEEKNDEWQIMLKAGDLQNALRAAGVNNALDYLLADTAFAAIRDGVNEQLAQLDSLLSSDDLVEIRALPAPSNGLNFNAIDITPASEPMMVPKGRRAKS